MNIQICKNKKQGTDSNIVTKTEPISGLQNCFCFEQMAYLLFYSPGFIFSISRDFSHAFPVSFHTILCAAGRAFKLSSLEFCTHCPSPG